MTDREKAIVMAYTEVCMLTGDKFQVFHKYIEDILGRPVMTHELAFLADVIKKRSNADFIELCKDGSDSIEPLEPEPCEDVPDTNDGNIYKCSCGYGWDKSKVVRHHFCPNCGRAVDNSIPCEDAVSRSEALKKFTYNHKGERIPDYDCDNFPVQIDIKTVKEILRDLPSVQPQPKTGHWIEHIHNGMHYIECSKCSSWFLRMYLTRNSYCPNCGAKMEVKE